MADWPKAHDGHVDLGRTQAPAGTALAGKVPHTLFDERWRMLRTGVAADRRNHGARLRRRALIPAAVASGVLAGTGFLSAWATSSTPSSSLTTSPVTAAPSPTRAALADLGQLQQTLDAERAAIAALPTVFPAAGTSASGAGAATGVHSAPPVPTATSSGPAVPTLPPLPAINIAPIASSPPATQGTTGASGLP